MNRVVITGRGLVTSLSCEVEDCWQRILAGESGVHEVKLFDCSEIKVKMGADMWDDHDLRTDGAFDQKRAQPSIADDDPEADA